MTPTYKVYAIEYARRRGIRREMAMGCADDSPIDVAYYVWLVVGEEQTLLVDLGFTPEAAEKRGRSRPLDLECRLKEAGAETERIRHVVLTHLHWDHSGHHALFPDARFHLQKREMATWTGRFARYPILSDEVDPDDIAAVVRLNFADQVNLVDGTADVLPGVRLHWVGGHTDGMQIVEVATRDGPAVIASDALKTYANLEANLPDPRPHCIADALGGYELIRRLAGPSGTVLAGHDADLEGIAEPVTDGIYRVG